MILADAQVEPALLSNTLIIVMFVISAGAGIGGIYSSFFKKSEKREVTFGFEPASKAEFEKHIISNSERHAQLFEKIEDAKRIAAEVADENYREMTTHVSGINRELGAIAADNKTQSKWLEGIDKKLTDLAKEIK